jgi:hypothetical protein
VDQVGLMVFPGVTSATVSKDYDCASTNPTILAYNNSPVYGIIPLITNYRLSNTAPLNQDANIVMAARGGASGCTQGIVAVGGQGTFYADAVSAAQTTLTTTGRQNVQKAIILLSDGDASASSVPSGKQNNQCQQAVTAANTARAAGTWVYSVAYGASTASSGSCSTDSPAISACATMQKIAQTGTSDFSKFYSSTTACTSPHTVSDLTQIFQNIGTDLTSGRLLPDNAT